VGPTLFGDAIIKRQIGRQQTLSRAGPSVAGGEERRVMKRLTGKWQEGLLVLSGVLGILGLATAALYVLHSTPYTIVAFMAGGMTMIGLSAAIFGARRPLPAGQPSRGGDLCKRLPATKGWVIIPKDEV
jgi:hypothetical protein